LKYVSTAKARCSTDQHFLATEILWVWLEEGSTTNSPRQRFHSKLFCKIVRYFCRNLYLYEAQLVSADTPPIMRSLKLHWQPLVFHTCKAVGRVVGGRCQVQCAWQRPPTTCPTTFHV
jgi:hypothetical protein